MPFFRYNYVIDGKGSVRGKSHKVSIHSVYCSFSEDYELETIAQEEAWDLYEKIVPEWFVADVGFGYESILPGESKGIGFYYLHVLANDQLVKKIHLRRRRRRQSFFDMAVSFIKTLSRWLS